MLVESKAFNGLLTGEQSGLVVVRLIKTDAYFFFGVITLYYIKSSAAFDSAHFLSGYNGKCANIHGHRWVIEACAAGNELVGSGEKKGMLMDFGDLKRELRAIADSFDHTLIYEKGTLREKTLAALNEEGFRLTEIPMRPTAENFAEYFFGILKEKGIPVKKVTVFETPDNCAEYEEDNPCSL